MKKVLCIFAGLVLLSNIAATEEYDSINPVTGSDTESVSAGNYAIAAGEVLLSNVTLLAFNRFVLQKPYAYISFDTIKTNVMNPWVWDQDEFNVNQLGHPYQGSFYFSAARANGMNFWLSGLYTAFGSVTWELFCETERPSINDLIITTTGGMMMGEMFHRIYSEAAAAGGWWAFLTNPMEAFNETVTGQYNREIPGRITSLSYHTALSTGFTKVLFEPAARRDPLSYWYYANVGGGLSLVYGKPYGLKTRIPYDHFNLDLHGEWSPANFQFVFASDGILFSTNAGSTETVQNTIGMGMHCDVVYAKRMDYASHAVGFTMKERILLPQNWNICWDLHANWILLGGSEFYYFISNEIPNETGGERRIYDFGSGVGAKANFSVSHPLAGTLSLKYMLYAVLSLQQHTAVNGSPGGTVINSITATYSHKITERYSMGITGTLFAKEGMYRDYDDITQYNFMSSLLFIVHLK